ILLADVTYPSLGVGYEICEALKRGKEVIAFYRKGVKVSKLISGNPSLILLEFSDVRELLYRILSALDHMETS
ncbi:MAG: deoxyribonucleoside 5'-monophosphate N-glycosidase, partial [Candidatus Korarchaeota archaeon]|nr:deoxyribonucleoside 5'-monophosphate N-glycosidase [Candidatus Korarchaeota archaeon]